jgi:hypothetical protein
VTTLIANPGLPTRFATAEQDGAAGRRDVWHVGLYAFRDHWLLGAGVGNFPNAFDKEYINVYTQYVLGWHWVAHNVPLTMATELGVVGFAIFLVAILKQYLMLRNMGCHDTNRYELRLSIRNTYGLRSLLWRFTEGFCLPNNVRRAPNAPRVRRLPFRKLGR